MALLIFGVFVVFIVQQINGDPGKVCPPASVIAPCTCGLSTYGYSYVKLTCGGITNKDTLTDVFEKSSDYQFIEFEMYGSSLMFLPVKLFEIRILKILSVSSVNFIDLFEEVPSENNSLETISLLASYIMRGVNWNHFSNFKKLNTIRFWDLQVHKFDETFIQSVSKSLTSLEAYRSSTRTLVDGCFAGFQNLKKLVIEGGSLTELKRNMFPSNLEDFVFRANKIAALPDDLFDGMSNLATVDLEGNLLTTIDEKVFPKNHGRLNIFTVDHNPIRCGCNIKWVLKYKNAFHYFQGVCTEPEQLKGKSFKELVEGDFSHC